MLMQTTHLAVSVNQYMFIQLAVFHETCYMMVEAFKLRRIIYYHNLRKVVLQSVDKIYYGKAIFFLNSAQMFFFVAF
jgi:hypothetical protein